MPLKGEGLTMKASDTSCNFLAPVVLEASVMKREPVILKVRQIVSPVYHYIFPKKPRVTRLSEGEILNLQPGEWVQVRSLDEISTTLDDNRKCKGLFFMVEMEKFCGKKLKVFKRVETIKLESTGEVRKLRSPTVFLENAYCDGERHSGCDRACFHFWREAWLKRIPE
jgi:hypothetical protein